MFESDSNVQGAKQSEQFFSAGSFTVSKIIEKRLQNQCTEFSFELHFSDPRFAHTKNFPNLIEHLVNAYPNLKRHRCDNDKSASFIYEIKDTEMAHAFEHTVVENIAGEGIPRRQITGKTGWRKKGSVQGPYHLIIAAPVSRMAFEAALRASVNDFKSFLV